MIIRAFIRRMQSTISALQGRRAEAGLARPLSTLAGLLFLGGATVLPAPASAIEPEHPGHEAFLTRAVFADGRLWILSDAGTLSSVTEGQDTRVVEKLPEKAFDLCVFDRHPMVITYTNGSGSEWTLRRRAEGAWSVAATIKAEGDLLLAMDCAANRVTLLTTRRLIDLDGNRQSTVTLSEPLNGGLVNTPHGTPDQFFVGINVGEWGGGLRRIDRHSGKVTVIEHNATGELCGGPLNTACDPVNGIVSVPWKPGCIAAAVGLVHFRPHGRVVEVCGDQVKRLYYKPYRDKPSGGSTKDDEPFSAVAFFGLARDVDTLWAVGIDGIYRIGPDGTAQIVSLPRFKKIGGINLSFDLPEFVLVLTNVNQRRSISGAVPILVPRR
ncbi:hypothetical protein CQ12_37150 [Bradyrhizobium jicamae]|uniref:Uncharacterized protein n=1 Tax=Bradyrhizobium jicamae TaxID=280332 RepID=A0A0R3L4Q5_9BRAD|nr:hypothetical protein [Bradyrhizobium jicamae]KRR02587.1 hypothetical protein CQ12_37150 [Bradyrhizobium jicamae]